MTHSGLSVTPPRRSTWLMAPRAFARPLALAFSLALPTFAIAAPAPTTPDASTTWMPAGIEQLGKTAAFHTDFTFDRTMLQLASGLIDNGDPETRNAIAKLDGVSVHLYRYAAPGLYDPRQLDLIRQQYKDAGWKHLVSKANHPTVPGGAPPPAGYVAPAPIPPAPIPSDEHIDLYINFRGTDVVGMVVVQANPRNLNVVAINGDISPVDLLHLRGHFGIPKFSADDFAPAAN